MYIKDFIGDEFKKWEAGNKIIISSPTGSGKSTFILRSLLPYAIEKRKHIVYICNRKILNDQFTVESRKQLERILGTDKLTEAEVQSIHITTYQRCETEQIFPYISIPPDLSGMTRYDRAFAKACATFPKATHIPPTDVLYYVFDEAHYFLSDALFNPNTNYWHGINRSDIISIFLTATPDPLSCFLASQNYTLYNEVGIVRQISDRYTKRRNVKDALSNPKKIYTKWNEEKHIHTPRIDLKTQAEIERICRTINPYEMAFHFIANSLDDSVIKSPNVCFYSQVVDYSYIHAKYFNKFCDLINSMVSSTDKWLVFISNKDDGIDLVVRLNERGVTAAYLTSETRHEKDSDGYREFLNIVEHQRFECKVLIATSVMDCGVSIKDPELRHIVIDQPDKTEFLQMLGRRRVDPNEIINLYIKYLSPKNIDSLRARCEKNLHFMVNFYRINEVSYDRRRTPTATDDGMRARSELPAETINRTVKDLMAGNHPTLVYNKNPMARADWTTTGPYSSPIYTQNSVDVLKEYQMSSTAFIQILYSLKGYIDALEVYRTGQDPVFYLKEQLSWLEKAYDIQNWVGYAERMKELSNFLEGYQTSAAKITTEQQLDFRENCLKLILALPMPIKAVRKDISRLKKGSTLGMKKLNDIFEEIGLPYRIRSKQAASGPRKTYWYVK